MKLTDIQKCCVCGRGLMQGQNIMFQKIQVTEELVDMGALQRAHGMELVMGGHVALARIMGPDEEIAVPFSVKEGYVCFNCGSKSFHSIVESLKETHAYDDETKKLEKVR